VFVSPSIPEQAAAAVEDTLRDGTWLDVATVLPPALAAADVAALLDRCCAGLAKDREGKQGQVRWRARLASGGRAVGLAAPLGRAWQLRMQSPHAASRRVVALAAARTGAGHDLCRERRGARRRPGGCRGLCQAGS
jgi:hypothetical protein